MKLSHFSDLLSQDLEWSTFVFALDCTAALKTKQKDSSQGKRLEWVENEHKLVGRRNKELEWTKEKRGEFGSHLGKRVHICQLKELTPMLWLCSCPKCFLWEMSRAVTDRRDVESRGTYYENWCQSKKTEDLSVRPNTSVGICPLQPSECLS